MASLHFYREHIELSVWLIVNHPLVYDDVVVKCRDGDGMRTGIEFGVYCSDCLSTQDVLFPALGAEFLFQTECRWCAAVNGYRVAQVTFVVGLGGDGCYSQHAGVGACGVYLVCQAFSLWQSHCFVAVAEQIHYICSC